MRKVLLILSIFSISLYITFPVKALAGWEENEDIFEEFYPHTRWFPIMIDGEKNIWAIDFSSLKTSGNIKRVWIEIIYSKEDAKTKKMKNLYSEYVLFKINCKDKTIGVLSYVLYDKKRNVLDSFANSDWLVSMEPVIPDSIGEEIYTAVCSLSEDEIKRGSEIVMMELKVRMGLKGLIEGYSVVHYKGVGYYPDYNEVLIADIVHDLSLGSAIFRLKGLKSGLECIGDAKVVDISATSSSAGQRGQINAICKDERIVEGEYITETPTKGRGFARDSMGNRIKFVFGLSEQEATEEAEKLLEQQKEKPPLPKYSIKPKEQYEKQKK